MDWTQVNQPQESNIIEHKSPASLIVLPNIEPIKQRIKDIYLPKLNQLVAISKTIKVRDETTEKQSIEMEVEVKKLDKELEKKVKEIIDKPDKFVREIHAFKRVFKCPINQIIKDQNAERKNYQWQKELERRKKEKLLQEAQAKAQKELEEKAKEANIDISDTQPVPPPIIPKEQKVRTESGATSYLRDHWVFKVVDISKVDRAFLMINKKAVDAQIVLGKRGNDLAGIEIYNDPISITRR